MSNERQGRGTRGATLINEKFAHSPAKLLTFEWLPCVTIRPNRRSYLVIQPFKTEAPKSIHIISATASHHPAALFKLPSCYLLFINAKNILHLL